MRPQGPLLRRHHTTSPHGHPGAPFQLPKMSICRSDMTIDPGQSTAPVHSRLWLQLRPIQPRRKKTGPPPHLARDMDSHIAPDEDKLRRAYTTMTRSVKGFSANHGCGHQIQRGSSRAPTSSESFWGKANRPTSRGKAKRPTGRGRITQQRLERRPRRKS